METSAVKLYTIKRTASEAVNETAFPNGLLEIRRFALKINDEKGEPRKIIIEIHKYNGFAMIKYYPHHLKKNPKKYEMRGKLAIGYLLTTNTVLRIIYESALIMRDYLDENSDEFVGYLGQKDTKDNKRKREQSQRSSVYNTVTSSIFNDKHKYKLSSKKKFEEINLRLIRMNKSKQEGKLTKMQMTNYNTFLAAFEKHPHIHYELMTDVTRSKFIKETNLEQKSVSPAKD